MSRDPAMVHWFGTPWPSPERPAEVCADPELQCDVPRNTDCFDCAQPILPVDSGVRTVVLRDLKTDEWGYYHVECWIRGFMCPVTIGLADTHDHDPRNRRQEGREVMAYIRERSD